MKDAGLSDAIGRMWDALNDPSSVARSVRVNKDDLRLILATRAGESDAVPVAWQYRVEEENEWSPWVDIAPRDLETMKRWCFDPVRTARVQFRELYARPTPAPASEVDIDDMLEVWNHRDLEPVECNAMRPRVTRAIYALRAEVARLRAREKCLCTADAGDNPACPWCNHEDEKRGAEWVRALREAFADNKDAVLLPYEYFDRLCYLATCATPPEVNRDAVLMLPDGCRTRAIDITEISYNEAANVVIVRAEGIGHAIPLRATPPASEVEKEPPHMIAHQLRKLAVFGADEVAAPLLCDAADIIDGSEPDARICSQRCSHYMDALSLVHKLERATPPASDEVREALRPLAEKWQQSIDRYTRCGSNQHNTMPAHWPVEVTVTVQHCRTAHTLLANPESAPEGAK